MKDTQNNQIIQKIEQFFEVPAEIADKIKNVVEKVKGGYILIETRPRWDGSPGPWTRYPVAKIIFSKPTKLWKLYWKRASGEWCFYGEYKTLDKVLKAIKEDKNGCFWG